MKETTMYRTIEAMVFDCKGIVCSCGKETIESKSLEYLYAKDFAIDGSGVTLSDGSAFYPAMLIGTRKVNYKCTMTEADFVKNADKVYSRFVNGRTRMVTRNVSSYTATCLCYDMEKQTMTNSQFSLPEDRGPEKNLAYIKKYHEEQGKFIICTVLNVTETEGIYAMTERRFFELADKEVIE